MKTERDLRAQLAILESQNDHLAAEVEYIDLLFRSLGFERGTATFKAIAEDTITNSC